MARIATEPSLPPDILPAVRDIFELHLAMLTRLIEHDADLAVEIGEFLESVANRYLDLSEKIGPYGLRRQRLNKML